MLAVIILGALLPESGLCAPPHPGVSTESPQGTSGQPRALPPNGSGQACPLPFV